MANQLWVYNEALTLCGERHLASLTESRESRRLLDHVWNNGGVDSCLEGGQWKFAMRTVRIDYDPDITPEFGYKRAFIKPSDWKATSALSDDEYFNTPLTQYSDEAGYWYSELDLIYVRYISNDDTYGNDIANWPQRFADWVSAYFASKIILKLTSDEKKILALLKVEEKKLLLAKSHDAMADPTKFPPQGNWSNSRSGLRRNRRDRGNRHNLIG